MESEAQSEGSSRPLRQLWSSYMSCSLAINSQEKNKHLKTFMIEFLKMYHAVKGDVSKMSNFGDIHSISNVLTSEFQAAILLRCHEGAEVSLVQYLCHGEGLLLLQMLCILANKIAGCSLDLANLLVSLLPVILSLPLREYDSLYGLELIITDFDDYYQDSKSTSHHSTVAKEMILSHIQTCYKSNEHVERGISSRRTHGKRQEAGSVQLGNTEIQIDDEGANPELSCTAKAVAESSSATEDSDVFTSVTSVTDSASANVSDCSDNNGIDGSNLAVALCKEILDDGFRASSVGSTIVGDAENQESLNRENEPESQAHISHFDLALLLVSTLENIACHGGSALQDPALLMHTSGQLINILLTLKDPKEKSVDVLCEWDTAAFYSVQLVILRTVFAILFTACKNPKSAKQVSKSSYVEKILEVVESSLDKDFLTKQQHNDLVMFVATMDGLPGDQKLRTADLWLKFQHELFLGCSLQGVLLFVTSCLNHGTVVNSSLMVLCQDLFEQFSASGGFECVSSLLMKLDEALLQESRTSALSEKVERSFVPSAHKIEQYPRNLTHQVVRNLGKMISLLKKGKNHCRSAAELSNKRNPARPVAQDEDYVMCDVYPQSSEVEESSESAADMECENERQRKFSGDLCPVSRPILTLLATFKESRTSELRMHVLCCLGKVGICHCISLDQLITSLLNRFVDQPKDIQGAVLKEINHLVLTEIDVMDGKFQTAQLHSSYPKGLQRTFSTKQNATKSDSGFSASDFSATGIATQAKGLCKETGASWTCLSQYCSLMTSTDSSVAVEVTRSLKAMATLGSRQLKGELFRTVVLPCILRYGGESAFGESHGVGEALRNTRARSWTGPFSPEWLEVRKKSVKRSTLSASDETFGDVFLSGQGCVEDGVSKEVLHLCISYLTALLVHQPSRELFLSCGGLNELQGFLVLPELQEPVLCVLEFLANVEDEEKSQKVHKAESGELSAGSPETSSEERTECDACCLSLLSLLHYTTQSLQRKRNPSENTSGTDMSLYHHAESSLRVHVWRSCLQLLVSNKLFRELFVQDDGMLYSYDLLHFLFGAFQSCSSGSEFFAVDTRLDDALFVRDLVSLFESVLPVCIRMAHTEQWQNTESLPSLDQLMQDAKKAASKSDTLRRFLGKRMSDSLLKALVWQFGRGADGAQWYSEIKQQREAVLRKTSNGDGQEEWLPTVEEDEETGGNQKTQRATLEAGYDADQEGDSDSSDVGEQRPVRNRKLPRERRKTEESKEQHCLRGLIIYPQICSFLFELLQVCYDCELCTSDSSSLAIVVHAVQSFLVLLKDSEQNCKILCQQGVIGTILECFHDVLISRDQAVQGLQSLVLDVFVCLASHSTRAAELWDFLSLFNSPAPPVNLLSAALSEVAAKVSFHPGPAYVIAFPCYGKGGEVWTKQTSRGTTAKLKQGKGKRFVRSKGQSPHGSDGDASSEDPGMNSGSSPSRSRLLGSASLEKQQLKRAASKTLSLLEGGKRRGTAKRRVRKHSWSHSGASGNSGDHELREVVELEQWTKLPSPFVVRAVQLPFLGSLPRSKRGFSLAMWICLTSPSLGSEAEVGAGTESRGGFGGGTSRISSPRRERILHLCSIGSGKRLFEAWIAPSDGSFLFRWTKDHKGSSKALSVLRETPVRVAAFKKGQWHHVVVSFTQPKVSAEDERKLDRDSFPPSKLLIVVDGTESTVHDFGPPLPWHEEAKFTLSTLLLGHVIDSESCKPANLAATLQDGYELGNVFVFTGKSSKALKHTMNESMSSTDFLVGQEEAFYLYSLGPNCTSMGQLSKDFKLVTLQPHHSTQPLLEAASLWSRLSITEQAVATDLPPGFLTSPHVVIPDLEAFVKKRLAAVYSPAFPVIFHQYAELLTSEDRQGRPSSVTEPLAKTNEYESTEMNAKVTSGVEPYRRQTLLESAHDVGGISVFIYLFAKVVEQTTDEKTQADILSVVLSLQYSSAFHARAMAEESGFALLKRILLTPECRIGYHTLKVLMEAACDGDVFKPTSLADDPVMLNIDSTAVVRNVAIFQHFLLNWKIWEKAKQGVLDMLLATIDILVHGSHCYYQFNIVQFQKAQLVQQILIGCQERQGECCKEIPRAISSLYVNIIQNIMGCPPDLTVLKAVCEFLIAMHPTEDTTRLHSPNRFYLREHSLDFDFTADWAFSGSSSVPRRFRQSPRTAPVRSLQSSNPFHFKSPEKHPPRNAMSRSLSFESLERKDALGTLGNKGGEGKGVLGSAPISNKRSTSAYGLNRSFPSVVGEEPDSCVQGADYGQSNAGMVTSSAEFETQQRNLSVDEGLASTAIASLGEDKNSADRKSSVGLSRSFSEESSALLLHEGHFGEPGFRGTPSPVRSPGTSLVMAYPGMRSVLGSKPVVIRNYGSTPSRDGQSSVDPMEYDFINESDFSSLRSSVANPPSSTDDYLVVEGFPGIQSSTMTYCPTRSDGRSPGVDAMIKLRLGLMKLLEKVLFTLPSEHVPAVIGEVLKAEYMLVWAYHDADSVRELAIRILFQYLQKAEPKRCEQFLRIYGFHLLANQLYDHSVTKLLIEGCLSLLVARQVDLKKDYDYSSADDRDLSSSVRPMGVVPLLALLENSVLKPSLFHLLIQHLCQLFIRVDDLCLKAVEHGLLETFCNVVYGLCTLRYKQRLEQSAACSIDLDSITEDVQQFVACIVRKACSTNGNLYFQMFEDLMIALENLEEQDHKKRDYDPCTSHCARHLRFFAVQVALHFFQEVSKGEGAVSGKKTKPSGIRLPFRGPDKNADPVPAFTPESSWVNLDRDTLKSCLDPSQLKKSPTNANFNEQTRRFQNTCQLAVNFIVQSKTFFLPEGFVLLDLPHVDLQVHAALRPAIVRVAGAAIEKEFAQFVFSLLVEILDACLDGRKREMNKLFIVSKDVLKMQVGKLLVFLLNPSQDLDLSCFALHLVHHPRVKKILETVLTSSGGPKLRERVAVYLLKLLAHPGLTDEQRETGEMFKVIMLSSSLQSLRLNSTDWKITCEEEMQLWDSADKASMMQWQKQRTDAYRRLVKRTDDLNEAISTVAKDVTRVVVEIQDSKRQALLKHTRDALSAEVQIRKKWRQLIERLIHERSVWHDPEHFPCSWRLDPTEGPGRVRCRLQRFHLDVDDVYLMEENRGKKSRGGGTPLSYLFEDTTTSRKKHVYYIFDTPDTIRFLHHCKNITLDNKIKGVLLIGESHVYFVGEEATADADITQILLGNKDAISISWSYEEIQEIRTRRHTLQDNALEIFLTTGRTYLLAFETKEDRETVLVQFKQRNLPCYETPQHEHLQALTTRWRCGQMTNFEYLTELNKMAGRSFNDLMQYPVFPFVLADFSRDVLDLTEAKTFRELSRPIAVQNQSKERKYRETFRWLQEEYERMNEEEPMSKPYHYGCHYSNSGTVLHFLVRLPPFTKMFLQYQDRSFDIPDRTFHSMATTWRLSSFESATDVKELIPEFFFLPDFLENTEGFNFGVRQNGQRVINVELPLWAKGSTRLFTLIHRQALESDYVSQHLNQWIDLVFGYKQMGPEAVEAINVFHPATYYGVDVNAITDPVRQKALKTMIETYGQTPQQLFTFPHSPKPVPKNYSAPPSEMGSISGLNTLKFVDPELAFTGSLMSRFTTSISSDTGTVVGSIADTITEVPMPVNTVEGLKWGQYVGSPGLGAPAVVFTQALNATIQTLVYLKHDTVFALSHHSTLLTLHQLRPGESEERLVWSAALSWGYMDGCLRVCTSPGNAPVCIMEHHTPDKITCCAVTDGCKSLFIGTSTGTLSVLPVKYNPSVESGIEVLGSRIRLYGHKDAITCIQVCQAFSIVVSGSCDKTAIIWDLNRFSYVRFLEHSNTVAAVAISRTSGDIATVSHTADYIVEEDTIGDGSVMRLWTVNGRFIGHVTCEPMINCLDFSCAPEGVAVNVIATGLSNGAIRLWSTWDLRHIRDIAPDQNLSEVACLAFSVDSQLLLAVNTHGKLVVWQRRDKPPTKLPTITVFPRA